MTRAREFWVPFVTALVVTALLTICTRAVVRAQEVPSEDTISMAEQGGVDPWDLQGALNSTGLPAEEYLFNDGKLQRPTAVPPLIVPPPLPIAGQLGQRIYCIEGIESRHGAAMWNPVPWGKWGEHAQGWLGWLPSTARSVGAVIGDRASEWAGAARMLALGRGREFYGIAAGLC